MPYRHADPSQLGRYRPGDGIDALIGMQLAIADRQDHHHCAVCGRHIERWHSGFPFPLCCFCLDSKRRGPRRCCPWPRPRPCTECGPCPGGDCLEFSHRKINAVRRWKEARHGSG